MPWSRSAYFTILKVLLLGSLTTLVGNSGVIPLFSSVLSEIDNQGVRVYHETVFGTGNHIHIHVEISPILFKRGYSPAG
jgi:hypothetical protein